MTTPIPPTHLITEPHWGVPGERYRHAYTPGDDFYEMLIEGHRGLSDEGSELMNARLVLLLANHIGDLRVLREAIAAARSGVEEEPAARSGVEEEPAARSGVEEEPAARSASEESRGV